tara:strand:- start:2455 stop:3111 length:657 start_codon:yes stop_codon:yes gene_type:complete
LFFYSIKADLDHFLWLKEKIMLELKFSDFEFECGTDEAGRGCLAGPITAAAVVLPLDFKNILLNDSKQLSHEKRESLKPIIELEAVFYGVAHVYPKKIDKMNILNASILAMHHSISQLKKVDFISVDGNRFKAFHSIPHQTIIKGDGKYQNIAAASVIAKTYRDAYMEKIHEEFPMYNWKQNKGYPTKEHREAIRIYGATKYHRMSFRLLPESNPIEL